MTGHALAQAPGRLSAFRPSKARRLPPRTVTIVVRNRAFIPMDRREPALSLPKGRLSPHEPV